MKLLTMETSVVNNYKHGVVQNVKKYMNLISLRSNGEIHVFDDNVLDQYEQNGYPGVKKVVEYSNVHYRNILLFPVFRDNNWTITVVDMQSNEITHFNSQMGSHSDFKFTPLVVALLWEWQLEFGIVQSFWKINGKYSNPTTSVIQLQQTGAWIMEIARSILVHGSRKKQEAYC